MAKPQNPQGGLLESMKTAQSVFSANPMFGPHTRHFWEMQGRLLAEAEKFSSAWFKRRLEATKTAIEASARLTADGAQDPSDAMKIITDWQTHSMERLAEDAKECAEMVTRCAGHAVSNEVEAMEEAAETTRRATATGKSGPV